jgi:N-acetyl-anhydromuramyl-L-alanine amidase AmpD
VTIIDVPNSNHKRRPAGREIEYLVIHGHGEWVVDGANDGGLGKGRVWHCTDWLRAIGLSCHAWCLPDGRIVREVDSRLKAFHAKSVNSISIGMEFVVPGVWTYGKLHRAWETGIPSVLYTDEQFEAGVEWFRARCVEHGIPKRRSSIRTHRELDPQNKIDPGVQFPLDRFVEAVIR